jgi:hypothetical protein
MGAVSAGREALGLQQRELAVLGGLAGVDAERFSQVFAGSLCRHGASHDEVRQTQT